MLSSYRGANRSDARIHHSSGLSYSNGAKFTAADIWCVRCLSTSAEKNSCLLVPICSAYMYLFLWFRETELVDYLTLFLLATKSPRHVADRRFAQREHRHDNDRATTTSVGVDAHYVGRHCVVYASSAVRGDHPDADNVVLEQVCDSQGIVRLATKYSPLLDQSCCLA